MTPGTPLGVGFGVVVLGMHRSGTSAVTAAIDALGLPAGRLEGRLLPDRWNQRGYFECGTLVNFNESLLNLLGGSWAAPPELPPGWPDDPYLAPIYDIAAALFGEAHPRLLWVWKDPRACLLMPFWDRVLGPGVPRVIVLRHPDAIAASLRERDGLAEAHAHALTERHLRSAFAGSQGFPVYVTAFEDMLVDPAAWCGTMVDFIQFNGLPLPEPIPTAAACQTVDPGLQHHQGRRAVAEPAPPRALAPLWEWAHSRRGFHAELDVGGLPEESPETSALFARERSVRSRSG